MTFQKKRDIEGFLHPATQPRVGYERLFNLMMRAYQQGILFIVYDECENEFDHREIHTLSLKDQIKLHSLARDEMARYRMRNEWTVIEPATDTIQ